MNVERIRKALADILSNYKYLLGTKDRELMHHVLFSFDCYHREVTKPEIWQSVYKRGLGDELRELYVDLVKTHILPAESVVSSSWRYHLTYLKVIETLINSSFSLQSKKLSNEKYSLND